MNGPKPHKRNKRIALYFALVITAVILAGYFFIPAQLTGDKGDTPQQAALMQPVSVTAIRVERQFIPVTEELPGRTAAFQIADIRPQVTGIITKRLFEEGSLVKEGQQLYQIDPAPYQATYNSAKADLIKAEANVKTLQARARRYEEVLKLNAVSRQEYDDAIAQLTQAKADVGIARAALATAKINLDYTKVYAPITGQIGRSTITKGALVTANQAGSLAQITQLDPIYVDMAQSSDELMQMRSSLEGKEEIPVSIFIGQQNMPYPHEGKLQFSEVTVDPTTGSVLLRAILPNPEGFLYPGLFVKAQIKLDAAESILIPQQAAIRNPDGSVSAWLVTQENKALLRPLVLGSAVGNQWIVKEGIAEGDIVIVEGFQKLQPEVPVRASLIADASSLTGNNRNTVSYPAAKEQR